MGLEVSERFLSAVELSYSFGLHLPWKEPIITATEMQYVDNLGEGEANMRDRGSILVDSDL